MAKLTKRQIETLQLLWDGYEYKEAADKLCVAHRTVHGYIDAARQTTGIRNTVSLIRYALGKGLIE